MKQEIVSGTPNLSVLEGTVEDLHVESTEDHMQQRIGGVYLKDGTVLGAKAVVITTGTFLNAEIFQGTQRWAAGRIGERSSIGLPKTLCRLGFKLGRLRTGTPPRLLKNTIDFSKFQLMPPDEKPIPFSYMTRQLWLSPEMQLPTYIGHTTKELADIVRNNIHENEHIQSETRGPRYCPSLEAKILKFTNTIHKTFLEHEGLDSELIYPQGMSTTFRPDIQLAIMRCIKGLEKVEIAQYGYGVQYDFVNPQQLHPTLETKFVKGLYLAGQINGTTGYEEAAAQGVLAGINAGAYVRNVEPMVIGRSDGYIGVLVDDLTSLGTNEPYRMFTSRAEFRLHLRPDNADLRLTEKGRSMNAVHDKRYEQFKQIQNRLYSAMQALRTIELSVVKWQKVIPTFQRKESGKVLSAFDLLYRHDIKLRDIAKVFPKELNVFADDELLEQRLHVEGRYAKQHKRLLAKMDEIQRESSTMIPNEIDYTKMIGLSFECREKFEAWRPQNLAAASRIPGVTPEGLATLLRYLRKGESAACSSL
ncbi:hypothetical protein QR680_000037 [Steinernema hermaphroditum]|uniref:tRNA uridine 5-carboxymethylaminomethyl modification enzyme C-terminal subdomain domain-containing protein n=1 Tax=Steinernema hermaphroditum TaxID=289476 RepID=A0AA39GT25_9BILA|nr:hypothetical protein QR680_000037 [Steinernema hermaphroditum]